MKIEKKKLFKLTTENLHTTNKKKNAQQEKATEKLKGIASEHGKTVSQLAISWVLSNPAVSVALVGSTKVPHVSENLLGDWTLPETTKREIDELVLSQGAGVGLPGMAIAT